MFIGHFGVGFGAKKSAPAVSLGILFIAAQFLDLLWPTLLLIGAEHVAIEPNSGRTVPLNFIDYPFSHSLVMVIFWSLLVGFLFWLIRKNVKSAVVIGICVMSHWVLDLIVHYPDLPLAPWNSPLAGFSLWSSPIGTGLVEGSIFLAGVILYLKATSARNRAGKFGLWLMVGLLILSHLANLFGPPPPSVTAIAWAGQLQWLFVVLAFWVDRNRIPR
ncbi:MAG TPA: metal-dependent hydrolase [Bacteroidota bacterium]|nr:metal-dependent hydrolase [Bacteroidota bacterium]